MGFPIRLPSAKFPEIGASVSGVVESIDEEAEIPHFNDKGQIEGIEYEADGATPLKQIDVVIRRPEGGKLTLHTNGGIAYAIGLALAEIGAEELEPLDTLTVTYVSDGAKKPGRNAPKQYTAEVIKPF